MAEGLGISPSYLNLIERNQRPLTVQLILKLLPAVYKVDAEEFQAGTGQSIAALREVFADPLLAGELPGDEENGRTVRGRAERGRRHGQATPRLSRAGRAPVRDLFSRDCWRGRARPRSFTAARLGPIDEVARDISSDQPEPPLPRSRERARGLPVELVLCQGRATISAGLRAESLGLKTRARDHSVRHPLPGDGRRIAQLGAAATDRGISQRLFLSDACRPMTRRARSR